MSSIRSLTLLGTGTSQGVPVLGCDCSVCRSKDPRDNRMRAAALLRFGEEALVVDAGPDFRSQLLRERVKSVSGVLITHEHNDHTAGLDDLRPYCFRQKIDMPVYCLPRVAADIRSRFSYAFSDYPGVPRLDIREKEFGASISFGGAAVQLLEVTHGQLPIFGFRWGSIVYLTDVKSLPEETITACAGADTVVISALHREGTHSHLSLEEALVYLDRIGCRRGILTHFSHRMGLTAELMAELPVGVEVGYDGMRVLE